MSKFFTKAVSIQFCRKQWEKAIAPDEADLGRLLKVLDESLSGLDTVGQLQVAVEA
jgi:hypothetical protein